MKNYYKFLGLFLFTFAFAFTSLVVKAIEDKDVRTISANDTSVDPNLQIVAYNLSFKDNLYCVYAVDHADDFDTAQHPVQMLFFNSDVTEFTVDNAMEYRSENKGNSNVNVNGVTKKVETFYSFGLSAKQMTEDLYARAYVVVGENAYYSPLVKYSALEYAYKVKNNNAASASLKKLVSQMLGYGSAAQENFTYNLEKLADATYYSVDVVGGTLSDGFAHGLFQANEKVTVTASSAEAGKKFNYWTKDGIKFSTDLSIEFTITDRNATFEVVWKDVSSATAQLHLTHTTAYDTTAEQLVKELPNTLRVTEDNGDIDLPITWITGNFESGKVGTQRVYATLVNPQDFDLDGEQIYADVTTLPYTFEINKDTGNYAITSYHGTDSELTVINNYKDTVVDRINANTFDSVSTLTNVVINNNIVKIEQGAFMNCNNIESITIPFVGEEENASSSSSYFGWIFGAPRYDGTDSYAPTKLTEVILSEGAKKIPENAFRSFTRLKNFVIPESVETIYGYAFNGCSSLERINVPSGLKVIKWHAFSYCTKLTRVDITDLESYLNISASWSGSSSGLFLTNGANLYLNGELVEEVTLTKDSPMLAGCTSIKKVVFTDSVTTIGNKNPCFENCINLEEVVMPSSITKIGDSSFQGCSKLNITELPSSLTSIGYAAFENTMSKQLVIPDSVTSIGNYAFSNMKNLKLVKLPNKLQNISAFMFYDCSSLEEVIIPESVGTIESYSFFGCRSLKNINLPENLYKIGEWSFYQCTSLTKITIPNRVTVIEDSTFRGCSNLLLVELNYNLERIGSSAFSDCYKLVEVINHSNLEIEVGSTDNGYIGYYAKRIEKGENTISCIKNVGNYYFYDNNDEIKLLAYTGSEEDVVLPNDYEGKPYEIGDYAFYQNSKIKTVTISDSVTKIGVLSFSEMSSLYMVIIGNSVASIGSYAFSNSKSLRVVINDSKVRISSGSYGANLLSRIETSANFSGVELIDDWLYYDLGNGEYEIIGYFGSEDSVIIPLKVTSIGKYAFYCSELKSVKITENVKIIDDYAFYLNRQLENIEFSEGLKSIGDYAFFNCGFKSICLPNSLERIESYAFYNCSNLTSITIPEGVTSIGSSAFQNCSNLTSIIIPDGVTSIGNYAFDGCRNLAIYCKASSQKTGWSRFWNSSNCPVVWGYTGEDERRN